VEFMCQFCSDRLRMKDRISWTDRLYYRSAKSQPSYLLPVALLLPSAASFSPAGQSGNGQPHRPLNLWVLAALLVNALGLTLLENLLHTAGDSIFARIALVTYLIGATVVVVAELSYIHNREWVYPQIVFHVVLAFLAQAVFGAALLQTGLVAGWAGWAGWATIIWNLVWLVILAIASPRNMYIPVLHHVAPLVIGIALLLG
jgi:hypothetical protein